MLVFYGSKYGTAKRYAEEFARRAGTAAMSVRGRAPAAEGQTVVFFGALYAGKVRGLKKSAKRAAHCARLLVVTVGLADPSEPQVAESRRACGACGASAGRAPICADVSPARRHRLRAPVRRAPPADEDGSLHGGAHPARTAVARIALDP